MNFAQSLKTNGGWDNEAEKNKIADWASDMDLGKIKRNVLDWNLSSAVPSFEKHVMDYWYSSYGLGDCDVKSKGIVKKDKNKTRYYICKDNYWKLASEGEIQFGPCSKDIYGEIRNGTVIPFCEKVCETKYICKDDDWFDVHVGYGMTSGCGDNSSIITGAYGEYGEYKEEVVCR